MSNSDSKELRKLERLAALLRDDGIEPESLTPQQVDDYLKASKLNLTEPKKRFDYLLKQAKARRRLEFARERRLKAVEQARAIIVSGASAVDAARGKVLEMIEKLKKQDPDQALVYAREFEKATPEDYATFQEDLKLLELESQENDSGNK
jgi:hypothetical protein